MLDTLTQYLSVSLRAFGHINWILVGIVGMFAIMICYVMWMQDPRHAERAMARKLEKLLVSDIVSAALQDACHRGDISADIWHKYNKRLAYALGLEDMRPKKEFNLNVAKQLSRLRLNAMGVNIAQGLKRMKKGKTLDKKQRVLSSLKKKA